MEKFIKYAPQEVIDELDTLIDKCNYEFPFNIINDLTNNIHNLPIDSKLYHFIFCNIENQKSVINHIMDVERLQPEREVRYYVVKEGGRIQLGIDDVPELLSGHQMLEYEFGMTEEQARGYAELFGGEPKEIK